MEEAVLLELYDQSINQSTVTLGLFFSLICLGLMVIVLNKECTEWDSDANILPGLAVSLHVDRDPVVLREVDAGGGVVLPQSLQILLLPTVVGRHPGLVPSETSTSNTSWSPNNV